MRKMKKGALLAALSGAMLFGGGGCLGDSGALFARAALAGAGWGVGAIPANLVNSFVAPLLAGLVTPPVVD